MMKGKGGGGVAAYILGSWRRMRFRRCSWMGPSSRDGNQTVCIMESVCGITYGATQKKKKKRQLTGCI